MDDVAHHKIVRAANNIPIDPMSWIRYTMFRPAKKLTGSKEYPKIDMTVQIDIDVVGAIKFKIIVVAKHPNRQNP